MIRISNLTYFDHQLVKAKPGVFCVVNNLAVNQDCP